MANRINNSLAANAIMNAVFDEWTANAAADFLLTPENHTAAVPPLPGKDHAKAFNRPAGSDNFALGANGDYIRGTGFVMVQVFIRKGSGSIQAQVAADYLEGLSNTQINALEVSSSLKITFRQVSPAIYSKTVDAYEMFMVDIPYFWDSLDAKTFAP